MLNYIVDVGPERFDRPMAETNPRLLVESKHGDAFLVIAHSTRIPVKALVANFGEVALISK